MVQFRKETPNKRRLSLIECIEMAQDSVRLINDVINNQIVPKTTSNLRDFVKQPQGNYFADKIAQGLERAYGQ